MSRFYGLSNTPRLRTRAFSRNKMQSRRLIGQRKVSDKCTMYKFLLVGLKIFVSTLVFGPFNTILNKEINGKSSIHVGCYDKN